MIVDGSYKQSCLSALRGWRLNVKCENMTIMSNI